MPISHYMYPAGRVNQLRDNGPAGPGQLTGAAAYAGWKPTAFTYF
jgi:hypothetical protein